MGSRCGRQVSIARLRLWRQVPIAGVTFARTTDASLLLNYDANLASHRVEPAVSRAIEIWRQVPRDIPRLPTP